MTDVARQVAEVEQPDARIQRQRVGLVGESDAVLGQGRPVGVVAGGELGIGPAAAEERRLVVGGVGVGDVDPGQRRVAPNGDQQAIDVGAAGRGAAAVAVGVRDRAFRLPEHPGGEAPDAHASVGALDVAALVAVDDVGIEQVPAAVVLGIGERVRILVVRVRARRKRGPPRERAIALRLPQVHRDQRAVVVPEVGVRVCDEQPAASGVGDGAGREGDRAVGRPDPLLGEAASGHDRPHRRDSERQGAGAGHTTSRTRRNLLRLS